MHVQPTEDLSSSTAGEAPTSNVLLDEFANIDNIYESYKPTIKSAVQLLKTDLENPKAYYMQRYTGNYAA